MNFLFFKQKTAYEMRISDWSSDVCSSDLAAGEMDGEAGACAPSWSHAWRAVAWNDRFCSRSRTSDAARSRDQGGDGKTDGGTHLAVVVARPHRGEQQRHGGAARRWARDRKSGVAGKSGAVSGDLGG